jgi:hypothetical protein
VLVRSDDLVIGQPAHAWVSGQLARAWGNDAVPAPSPREPVCLAAEQHDVGWADADLTGLLGDDGRPLPFLAVPRAEHVAIWRDAARRMLAQSRYAALLVSLHGTSLYERVDADAHGPELAAAIRAYVAGQRALQASLSVGLDPAEIDRNRRLILALDRFSLALCNGSATTLEGVPGAPAIRVEPVDAASAAAAGSAASDAPGGGARLRDDRAVPAGTVTVAYRVAPWPLGSDRVVVGCEARRLPGRFDSAAALEAALAGAPWVPLRWELSPG